MLKTLRITSLAALVLAVCGVLFIVFLGLREDPEIIAYLEQPGMVDRFKNRSGGDGQGESKSLLVEEASKLAVRLDPPPPPVPPAPPKREEPAPRPEPAVARPTPRPTPTPGPKTPTNAKFTLLGTVVCEHNPDRSMVLLRQVGGSDEWFWQGERVGHLDIAEIRDGSAVFTQNGRNPQELFVPPKPQTTSLLKADAGTTNTPGGLSTIDVRMTPQTESGAAVTVDPTLEGSEAVPASNPIRVQRGPNIPPSREAAPERIRRVRTVPKPPTPAEKKADIENSIGAIQQIMSREAGADSEKQQQENEAWLKLLDALQGEKQKLENTEAAPKTSGEAAAAETGEGEQAGSSGQAGQGDASADATPATTDEE